MNLVCLDLEGVLVPEIWIEFSKEKNIKELSLTTKDEPDYDKLMKLRIDTLEKHGYGIDEICNTIERIEPFEGAKKFLDELRDLSQTIILSDTFEEFAKPIMKKLGMPVIFCNKLIIENKKVVDYKMRVNNSKYTTVKAFHSIGYDTIVAGDSFNDIGMIRASKAGFLFKPSELTRKENPDLKVVDSYEELLSEIKKVL